MALEISPQEIKQDFGVVKEEKKEVETDIHKLHLIQTIQSLLYINSLPADLSAKSLSSLNRVDLPRPAHPS